MAPEQLAGNEVTVRSDIYALGLVLYEIFTGKLPFESDTLAGLMRAQRESAPVSPSTIVRDLDPMVERVILRCLSPKPAMRPASALAVAAALPGGDPLAAALAAGETPSPEMVAAAGEGEGTRVAGRDPATADCAGGTDRSDWGCGPARWSRWGRSTDRRCWRRRRGISPPGSAPPPIRSTRPGGMSGITDCSSGSAASRAARTGARCWRRIRKRCDSNTARIRRP